MFPRDLPGIAAVVLVGGLNLKALLGDPLFAPISRLAGFGDVMTADQQAPPVMPRTAPIPNAPVDGVTLVNGRTTQVIGDRFFRSEATQMTVH